MRTVYSNLRKVATDRNLLRGCQCGTGAARPWQRTSGTSKASDGRPRGELLRIRLKGFKIQVGQPPACFNRLHVLPPLAGGKTPAAKSPVRVIKGCPGITVGLAVMEPFAGVAMCIDHRPACGLTSMRGERVQRQTHADTMLHELTSAPLWHDFTFPHERSGQVGVSSKRMWEVPGRCQQVGNRIVVPETGW